MFWRNTSMVYYRLIRRLRCAVRGKSCSLEFMVSFPSLCSEPHIISSFCDASLPRLRDFLLFLDRLELQFHNAQQGTALGVIPLTPKPSIIFVRSNKKMLDEWFSRIRGRIIEGAKSTGEHEIVIRNGFTVPSS